MTEREQSPRRVIARTAKPMTAREGSTWIANALGGSLLERSVRKGNTITIQSNPSFTITQEALARRNQKSKMKKYTPYLPGIK